MHSDTPLRTPPTPHAHTDCGRTGRERLLGAGSRHQNSGRPTNKQKLRGASRRQHKRERRGVCVSVCVDPSCARWLVAKEFSPHRHRASRRRPQVTTLDKIPRAPLRRRAADRLRAAAARQAARDSERARRDNEAAVKRSDLANSHPVRGWKSLAGLRRRCKGTSSSL